MRRSGAPSMQNTQNASNNFNSNSCNSNKTRSTTEILNLINPNSNNPKLKKNQDSKRSTEDILQLIQQVKDPSELERKNTNESKPESSEKSFSNAPTPFARDSKKETSSSTKSTKNTSINSNKVVYRVCYGKKTTKKHKTYENDGFLEVTNDFTIATLKDINGKYIGVSRKRIGFKFDFDDCDVISIGNNEVQIIELHPDPDYDKENIQKRKLVEVIEPKPKRLASSTAMSNNSRSTATILTLIEESKNEEVTISGNSEKLTYCVCFGKQTSRKNKTFEEDGFLELNAERTNVILTDVKGKIMGRSFKQNGIFEFQEGDVICVGSKEVQIGEIYKANINTVKDKPSKVSKNKCTGLKVGLSKKVFTKQEEVSEQFIMPKPPAEHQWKYNESKQPLRDVIIDSVLTQVLRPHQREGVIFLYKCVLGFYNQGVDINESTQYMGAILADEMGLGKTLQCITLIWTLLNQGPYGGIPVIRKILIVAPSSLLQNWQCEFQKWLVQKHRFIKTLVIDSKDKIQEYIRYQENTPVVIISYEMLVRHYNDLERSTDFDLMVCDEGHRLKNDTNKITVMLASFTSCTRRVLLTGTPIQNDLQEFYALMNFVNPGCLGSYADYRGYYEQPILQSQQCDVNAEMRSLGETRAAELNEKMSVFMLRRTQEINQKYLPVKHEMVVFCGMMDLQRKLYEAATNLWMSREITNEMSLINYDINHLSVIVALKKICNHPSLIKKMDSQTESDIFNKLTQILPSSTNFDKMESGKFQVVDSILHTLAISQKKTARDFERVVIVSYFTQTLDMFAAYCTENQFKYCRLDGSTPTSQRNNIVKRFNQANSDIFIFLLSARAGGVGLNLVGASRLILYDTDWNPATDLQAMARVWRDGQLHKNVYIYRLLTSGSIEEKIFQRQLFKTGLSGAVIDPNNAAHNIKFTNDDLKDLFTLNLNEKCCTHDLLECSCSCNGEGPETEVHVEKEERDCQLYVREDNKLESLRMDELKLWEHHGVPFNEQFLSDLALNNIQHNVNFIFRNKTTSKTAVK